MSVFINHDKKLIVLTDDKAEKNIGIFLFEAIRNNKWSMGDKIELSFIYKNQIYLKKLYENEKYECNCATLFYNF